MTSRDVSVVIPTWNRSGLLEKCLESLGRQSLERDRLEVVVVCDGCTDDSATLALAVGDRIGLRVRSISTERGGPGQARNVGVRSALGRVIAFTDDDVEHDPGWLQAGLAGFGGDAIGGDAIGGVEGRTEPVMGDESLFTFNLANRRGGLYPTCNMFYLRAVLDLVGGFEAGFRRVREDSDLALRVQAAGYRIAFADDAVVYHRAHHVRPEQPRIIAREVLDSLYLCQRHPERREFRPRPAGSDLVAIAASGVALGAVATGQWSLAAGAVLGYLAIAGRAVLREVRLQAAVARGSLLSVLGVYATLPWVRCYYLVVGYWRLWRGVRPSEPVAPRDS